MIDVVWVVLAYVSAVFVIAMIKRDNSIMDIAWGPGFVLIAYYTLFSTGEFEPQQLLVTGLVSVWGLRLAYHIFRRKRGKGEDFRYVKWRETWGRLFVIRSYFQIFILQGLLMIVVSTAVIIINTSDKPASFIPAAIGMLIWLIGFYFESRGDRELKEFISSSTERGRLMTTGLWAYTRHPNYFGEATQWWGIFVIALSYPYGYLSVISPVVITTLLLKVSGVPLLEKSFEKRIGWSDYARRTNKFIPWFPKK